MKRPKVCFLGNCQAQAFESLSGHLGLDIEVIRLPPVFLISEDSRSLFETAYAEADYIFTQRVSDEFDIRFVQTRYIKEHYPHKSKSWPNIYFDGYFPGIKYIYSKSGQKLVGPLGDYHIPEVIAGWKKNEPAEETARKIQEGDLFFDSSPVESSIYKLADKEVGLDCVISDYVRERFRSRRLFYSMNHPTTEVLAEMLRRLFAAAKIDFDVKNEIANYQYNLDQVIIPIYGYFREKYRPSFKDDALIKTFFIDDSGSQRNLYLNWNDAVDSFYKLYDSISYDI